MNKKEIIRMIKQQITIMEDKIAMSPTDFNYGRLNSLEFVLEKLEEKK
jgi:hypothetical protein